jgi:DNA-binding transcriptional LysR family regulator
MPMLRAGLGPARQPEFLVWEDLSTDGLEAVMTDWSIPPMALNIVMPPGTHRPVRVAAVIDVLACRLSGAAWALAGDG